MSTAIEFDHVSKQYRLGLVSTGTLSHDLNRWWAVNILRKVSAAGIHLPEPAQNLIRAGVHMLRNEVLQFFDQGLRFV